MISANDNLNENDYGNDYSAFVDLKISVVFL